MKKIIALSLCLLFFGFIGCSSGGGSGSSGDNDNIGSALVGTWSMVSSDGDSCSGCIVLTFNADGTGSVTDNIGYYYPAGTTVQGTWNYDGVSLTVTANDGTYSETDPASISGNTLTYGVNVYQKQ